MVIFSTKKKKCFNTEKSSLNWNFFPPCYIGSRIFRWAKPLIDLEFFPAGIYIFFFSINYQFLNLDRKINVALKSNILIYLLLLIDYSVGRRFCWLRTIVTLAHRKSVFSLSLHDCLIWRIKDKNSLLKPHLHETRAIQTFNSSSWTKIKKINKNRFTNSFIPFRDPEFIPPSPFLSHIIFKHSRLIKFLGFIPIFSRCNGLKWFNLKKKKT